MLNQNKLETLNQANLLLNQKHAKLGLKPMLINGTSPEMFRAALERKLSERVLGLNRLEREEPSSRIVAVADDFNKTIADLSDFQPAAQPTTLEPARTSNKAINLWGWVLGLIIAGTLILLAYNWWASSLSVLQSSDTILVSSAERPLVITAGSYSKRSEAAALKSDIERITGDKVRVLKVGSFYALQIGESYKRSEDAYLVFDELVKYPLRDLAIRSI